MGNRNPANAAAENSGKLSWLTRVAYGLGDTAQNIVWGAMSILTFFYTDYAGIDPAMVGLVFLLSRCFDGFRISSWDSLSSARIPNGASRDLGFSGRVCRLRYRLSSSIPYRKVPQHSSLRICSSPTTSAQPSAIRHSTCRTARFRP